MNRNFQIFKHFVKSLVTCVHFASDCAVEERIEKYDDDGDYESWHCLCVCKKCGKKDIEKDFVFSKLYLNALRAAGVE